MAPPRKVVREQLEILIGCLEENEDMSKGPLGSAGMFSYQAIKVKWVELAKKLNTIVGGDRKTPDAWRKYWFEFRHKCRKKAADGRRFQSGADTGRNKFIPLNDLEIRVLELSGPGNVTPIVAESQKCEELSDDDSESDQPLSDVKHKPAAAVKQDRIKIMIKRRDPSNTSRTNDITETSFENGYMNASGNDSCASPPPRWAIELEERRIKAQERTADALASMAAMMQNQEERRAMLDERTADAITAIAGTVQDLNSGVHEAVRYLQQMHEKKNMSEFDDKPFTVNKVFYTEHE